MDHHESFKPGEPGAGRSAGQSRQPTREGGPEDPQLRRLLKVELPPALRQAITIDRLFDDDGVDRLLRAVEVPANLAERVVRRAARRSRVVDLEAAASRVGRPNGRIAVASAGSPRALRWAREVLADFLAAAAAIAVMVAVAVGSYTLARRVTAVAPGPDAVVAVPSAVAAADGDRRPPQSAAPVVVGRSGRAAALPAEPVAPSADATAASRQPWPAVTELPDRPKEPAAASTPILAAPNRDRSVGPREMMIVPGPAEVPRVPRSGRGIDLAFEITHGEASPASPAVAEELAVDRPPLSLQTDSFDAALAAARSSDRSGRDLLRTEHLLAAMTPGPYASGSQAKLPGGATLHLEPIVTESLRGPGRSLLVELSVTAAGPPPSGAAKELIVVLDHSSAPGNSQLWSSLLRGLRLLAGRLAADDRVTLMTFAERPTTVVSRASAEQLAAAIHGLGKLAHGGLADIDRCFEAIGRTRQAVLAESGRRPKVVVVAHDDTLRAASGAAEAVFADWQAGRGSGGAEREWEREWEFVWIDPTAAVDDASGRVGIDSLAVRRRLLAATTSGRPLVRDCRLEVHFDPATVSAYRIVGFRIDSIALPGAFVPPVDLCAGETVRAVYEVVARGEDSLGTAVLRWRAAGSGSSIKSLRAEIPAAAAGAVPRWHLRELLLAVGTGELAGRSKLAGSLPDLAASVAEMAGQWVAEAGLTEAGEELYEVFLSIAGGGRGQQRFDRR